MFRFFPLAQDGRERILALARLWPGPGPAQLACKARFHASHAGLSGQPVALCLTTLAAGPGPGPGPDSDPDTGSSPGSGPGLCGKEGGRAGSAGRSAATRSVPCCA